MVYSAKSDISETISPFNYRRKLTINHSGALTSYQVKLIVDHVNTNMKTDFGDIRFNTEAGDYIPYWIEKQVNDISADVWIKTDLSDGNTIIYMYYGNATLTSESNGTNTFVDFSDFDNLTGWTQQSGTWTTSGSILTFPGYPASGDVNALFLRRNNPNPSNTDYIVRLKFKPIQGNVDNRVFVVVNGPNPLVKSSVNNIIEFGVSGGDGNKLLHDEWGTVTSSAATHTTGNWLIGEIRISDAEDSIKSWDYNSGVSTGIHTTTNTKDGGDYWGLMNYYDGASQMDWILIRKYTATEPTLSTFAEQTDQSYTYRLPIVIDNTSNGNILTNYQVSITVDTSDVNKFHNSSADIRFTSDTSSYNEQLWSISYPYWIESITNPAATKIWIKVDSIPANSTNTIYMYYGNATAASTSNGNTTFIQWHGAATNVFYDANICTPPLIYEAYGRATAGSGGDAVYWGIKSNESVIVGDSMWIDSHAYLTNTRMITYNDSTGNIATFGAQYLTLGTWRRIKMIHDGSGITGTIDNTYSTTRKTSNIPTGLAMGIFFYYGTAWVGEQTWSFVRKYASPEPTLSTPAIITATTMTISRSETPCRFGFCTVTVDVTWTNDGGSTGSFVPSITIDDNPITPVYSSQNLGAGASVTKTFTLTGLPAGIHPICPYPN